MREIILDDEDFVKDLLNNKSLCPCLLIGRYVNEFKKVYKGNIIKIYTLQNVRDTVEEFEGISNINDDFLVLEGIGYLSEVGQNSLLKFIEESKLPIVILSYNDKISPIIMSRMKFVKKKWYPVKGLSFQKVVDAEKSLEDKKKDKNFKEYEEIQFLADNCPILYSLKQQAGDKFDYLNNRMINIICGKWHE